MVYQTGKTKWGIFSTLILLIFTANYTIYHQPIFFPLDNKIVIASLIDFIIVIPVMTYLFIIRKRYSLKMIGIPVLGGYGAAKLIIPDELLSSYSQVTWFIIAGELIIVLMEIYLLYKIVTKFPKLVKEFKERRENGIYFPENISIVIEHIMPHSLTKRIMSTEAAIYYYALFSYRKKLKYSTTNTFTYHLKTSSIALNIMLIHAIAIETIGLHYLLHQMNPILSYILLILNVYTVLLFLAEIQAIRLSPIQLNSEKLNLQIGLMKRITVPINQIANISYYSGPDPLSKTELKHTFDARINDFITEKPTFEVTLKEPLTANLLYGFTKKVDRIVLTVDEPERFYQALKNVLNEKKMDED
ncbi:hypothetical protein [Neobacillus sp. D3-1R]|uniref:hypothetical protein n=1 Tax=Neobacillus sp. D3-1R TaxID=3445778 RepID=UPI003FA01E0A